MGDILNVAATLAALAKKIARVDDSVRAISRLPGPRGEDGVNGKDGRDGLDGVNGKDGRDGADGQPGVHGRDGLDGVNGKDGRDGTDGKDGKPGRDGKDGADGKDGEKGDIPDHQWQGTKLRFQKPSGKWGKFTDLKGKDGTDGKNGGVIVVGRGAGGAGLESLLPGTAGTEPAGIAVVQGGQWVNLPWAAFISVIAGAIDMGVDYSKRDDFVGDSVIYRGVAVPGADESAAVWKIKKVEFINGDVKTTFAGGNSDFVHVWADRAALVYS